MGVESARFRSQKGTSANIHGRQLHKQQIDNRWDLEFTSTKADLRLNGED
jgi:hypothetical protein